MDWVQQKEGGRKRQKRKIGASSSTKPHPASASLWLDDLCAESIATIQSNLPTFPSTKASKRILPLGALQWGVESIQLADRRDSERLAQLLSLMDSAVEQPAVVIERTEELAAWISNQLPTRHDELCVALTAAGWIHGLHTLGRHIKPSQWLDTLQCIFSQVDRAWVETQPENLLTWLIWSCEIPLALATQLSQLGAKDRIVGETLDRLAAAIEAAGEHPELWLFEGTRHLRSLLACVYRCRATADSLGARRWYRPQRLALTKLVRMAIESSDRRSMNLFVNQTRPIDESFWIAMHRLCGAPRSIAELMRQSLDGESLNKLFGKNGAHEKDCSPLSYYNERASLAWMRHSWKSQAGRGAIEFGSDDVWLNLIGSKGERIVSGSWELSVWRNDSLMQPTTSWKEICWFSDKDVDAIELECHYGDTVKLQRQVLFLRRESLFFLADALLAQEATRWQIESRLPLADGLIARGAAATRELAIHDSNSQSDKSIKARVIPLGLSEWRREPASGELVDETGFLTASQSSFSCFAYLPMVIALKRNHLLRPVTWRRLTVAENMRHVDAHVATAMRLQIGSEQWVFYRSLAETRKRSTLGLHLRVEFYAGRFFSKTGKHESLIEVESSKA